MGIQAEYMYYIQRNQLIRFSYRLMNENIYCDLHEQFASLLSLFFTCSRVTRRNVESSNDATMIGAKTADNKRKSEMSAIKLKFLFIKVNFPQLNNETESNERVCEPVFLE